MDTALAWLCWIIFGLAILVFFGSFYDEEE